MQALNEQPLSVPGFTPTLHKPRRMQEEQAPLPTRPVDGLAVSQPAGQPVCRLGICEGLVILRKNTRVYSAEVEYRVTSPAGVASSTLF